MTTFKITRFSVKPTETGIKTEIIETYREKVTKPKFNAKINKNDMKTLKKISKTPKLKLV